jgi:hypothetical protein
MRRRCLSLIEVVISLGLLTLLLSTLFFWYRSLMQQKYELAALKSPLVEEKYAEQRLNHILTRSQLPLFSTYPDHSLVFLFDRGICPQPDLSGKVLGRLFFEESKKSLYLGVWPDPAKNKESPCQTTLLLDKVNKCDFMFYYPPDPFKKTVSPEEVGKPKPREGWQAAWKEGYRIQPAMIKITIERDVKINGKNHVCEYVFDLPLPIIYPQEALG